VARGSRGLATLLSLAGLVAAWALAARIAGDPALLPSPLAVAAIVAEEAASGRLWLHLGATLARVGAFVYESITTAYLAYPSPVALPAPIARLDDTPGQWVFDRSAALGAPPPGAARALLAVVISAGGAHDRQDHAALAAAIGAQLRRLAPALPPPLWSRVIAERRATYACTPALARPAAGRVACSSPP